MDKNLFLNAGNPPLQHFEPSMPTWQSLSSAVELNCSSDQSSDCFLNPPYWDKSSDQYTHFESALSSMVTSPAVSNSAMSNESFVIRELIGKLGTICNSREISPPLMAATTTGTPYIGGGNNSTNTSCYSTPVNSPPKLRMAIMDQLVKENLPNLRNSMPLNPALPVVSADPGFAERAAKFSCFGSRSFNGPKSQFGLNNTELQYKSSAPSLGSGMLPRVFSSPSLKAAESPMENKHSAQTQMGMRSDNGFGSVSDKKLSKLSGSAANSNEESSVSEQIPSGETGSKTPNEMNSRKRKAVSRGKSKEDVPIQSATKIAEADDDTNAKRPKPTEENGNEFGGVKTEEETKGSTNDEGNESQKLAKANTKPPEPLKDYIHVRARRGQATDSHSLAERVRREKISERMKLLQDLVPGCNKVTGKALMLDEIINYVQSLQRQVEFLSMKLSTVNPSLEFNMDGLLSKEIFQPNGSLPHPVHPLDPSAPAFYGHQPQQSPQQKNISAGPASQCSADKLDATFCRNFGMQLPPVEGFSEGVSQFPTFCEDDLQSIVQMGLGQSPNQATEFRLQSFPVQNQTSCMKIEL
ncbi:unnamed protein product [Ilex paraguariensis]|uniref:BHLH domain-containing protein n=1 Tax=Ilex paraguariensis TaxID=185542 RepID=A0ABC8SD95_9AQUA